MQKKQFIVYFYRGRGPNSFPFFVNDECFEKYLNLHAIFLIFDKILRYDSDAQRGFLESEKIYLQIILIGL